MRRIWILILLLAVSCQRTTVNGQQTLCTVPEPVEGTTLGASTSSATAYPRNVDCRPLSVDIKYNCAKAHYYHAVGLTEKDDIVGACEHYLIALEIMEEMMAKDKRLKAKGKEKAHSSKFIAHSSEYEKTRFLALIYNRLGRLFLNENYCDLAILKYKKALEYVEKLGNKEYESQILKSLGNSYQINSQVDSALFYYDKSLKISSNLTNKLDVEKSIAKLLYNKGEKDSAYFLVKNNLDKIESYSAKNSYYALLGEMYYKDKEYDSAIYYLEKNICSNVTFTQVNAAIKLSAIYDSIDNLDKKTYYNDIAASLSVNIINDIVKINKLQSVYDAYKKRKIERERLENKERIDNIIISFTSMIIFVFIICALIAYRYKRKELIFAATLYEIENDIASKTDAIVQINEDLKSKEKMLQELKFKNSITEGKIKNKNIELQRKEELINKYEIEISELKGKLARISNGNINIDEYLNSKVCAKILNQIKELSEKNINTANLTPLEHEDFVVMLNSANYYLNNLINNITSKYPKLKKEDLYYLCMVIIGLNNKQISSLFDVTYAAVRKRMNKIYDIFDLDSKENLYNYLLSYV